MSQGDRPLGSFFEVGQGVCPLGPRPGQRTSTFTYKLVESDLTSSYILIIRFSTLGCGRGMFNLKKDDVVIYACVIAGAGVGLLFDHAFPGVLIGLGIGYLFKTLLFDSSDKK